MHTDHTSRINNAVCPLPFNFGKQNFRSENKKLLCFFSCLHENITFMPILADQKFNFDFFEILFLLQTELMLKKLQTAL